MAIVFDNCNITIERRSANDVVIKFPNNPRGIIPLNELPQVIGALILSISQEKREDMMSKLPICASCWGDDPNHDCQCWNDD